MRNILKQKNKKNGRKNEFQIALAKHIDNKKIKVTNEILVDVELSLMKKLFEDEGHKFNYEEVITNNQLSKHINNVLGYDFHIKKIKSILKKYCNARNLYIFEKNTTQGRCFKICKTKI